MTYQLTKSKYIRGLQCVKAMYLDVHNPELAYYPPEVLARFRQGRNFERSFKDLFPKGIDISARLKSRISDYPLLTAKLLASPGEVTLFEAGFLYDEVLVLADVVCKDIEGNVTIYEVKNGRHVTDTFRNDVAIQSYVIRHAVPQIQPNDLFCQGLRLSSFSVLYNNGQGGFSHEDYLEWSITQQDIIAQNITRFKQTLQSTEPQIHTGPHCNTPYECPYKRYCSRMNNLNGDLPTPAWAQEPPLGPSESDSETTTKG